LNDGSVKCWGDNSGGVLGLGDKNHHGDGPDEMGDNLRTVNLGTNKTAEAIAAGEVHTCAILNDGSVKCWGFNGSGQLGLGDTIGRGAEPTDMGDNLRTVNLGAGKTAKKIAAGGDHTCAILNDGSVKCWGANSRGALGLGDKNNRGDGSNEMGDNLPTVKLYSDNW
jgi:alpha-tubulin suppressor-like RCC1 family protein